MTEHTEIVDVSAEEQARCFVPAEAIWPELSKAKTRLERKGCTAFRYSSGTTPHGSWKVVITGTAN